MRKNNKIKNPNVKSETKNIKRNTKIVNPKYRENYITYTKANSKKKVKYKNTSTHKKNKTNIKYKNKKYKINNNKKVNFALQAKNEYYRTIKENYKSFNFNGKESDGQVYVNIIKGLLKGKIVKLYKECKSENIIYIIYYDDKYHCISLHKHHYSKEFEFKKEKVLNNIQINRDEINYTYDYTLKPLNDLVEKLNDLIHNLNYVFIPKYVDGKVIDFMKPINEMNND